MRCKVTVRCDIERIMSGNRPNRQSFEPSNRAVQGVFGDICPTCGARGFDQESRKSLGVDCSCVGKNTIRADYCRPVVQNTPDFVMRSSWLYITDCATKCMNY